MRHVEWESVRRGSILLRTCSSSLYFENSVCVSRGTWLGFSRAKRDLGPVGRAGRYVDHTGKPWWVCRNLGIADCTWLTAAPLSSCFACGLSRTRPNDEDAVGVAEFLSAGSAKRYLVVELDTLAFRVVGKGGLGLTQDKLSRLWIRTPARRTGSPSTCCRAPRRTS